MAPTHRRVWPTSSKICIGLQKSKADGGRSAGLCNSVGGHVRNLDKLQKNKRARNCSLKSSSSKLKWLLLLLLWLSDDLVHILADDMMISWNFYTQISKLSLWAFKKRTNLVTRLVTKLAQQINDISLSHPNWVSY